MIVLAADPTARVAIDETIDTALARIRVRSQELGDGAAALAEAITRAAAGGKRFRPALVVAAFEAFGGDAASTPALYPVAAAFEILHTAFVVHDDVIDHDTERRGIPDVAGEFRQRGRMRGADATGAALLGDAAAILAGDLLLHEAARLLALADTTPAVRGELMDLLDDAVFVSVAGELADVEHAVAWDHADSDAILAAAHDKTAVYSFSAPLRAGGALAGASPEALAALERFGGRLGLAFQLVDDLIGAFGTSSQAGRATGGDLREAKRTPLVAMARDTPSWHLVNDALALAHTGPIAVREAQRILDESGARERLVDVIDETLASAREEASSAALPAEVCGLLRSLTTMVAGRMP
ncbi:polyprenyl synthetase family protein [Microbacterium rhizomatis]|uniref:Polyprenyl synthetase family protein n=1 Tax=Microbacterium rhizomatis TaxID=1631477 RepID=A0A5J5J281_9MICO|nr:polyprenyl synthetase family protein [Microbacterium rhizomatis]KAA9110277.1 polyprenyl synthetase family protein [Microbacterium rhizomatis]